ncbi:hypothetical protein ACFUJR_27815 [Streptomyces sp. NPDC057271]|uniref:hypothetical protein n=1 Tax=unclassified Streptomyces TaxID=2593676 RepID=UPI0036432B13
MRQPRQPRFTWTPELSARARQLRDSGASLRDIGAELGAGKDAVRRHLATLPQPPEQPQQPVSRTLQDRVARLQTPVARRNEQAFAAMEQLRDTVALVVAERIPYLIVGETRARQLEAELRQRATELLVVADSFRDLYPNPDPAPETQPAGQDRHLAPH